MIRLDRLLPVLGFVLGFCPAALTAQTPEMIADVERQLHALRTAGPLVLPSPVVTIAVEEASIRALVAKIDRHLDTFWAKNGIKPSIETTDAEFLRRVSLDLVGRIPSVREIRQFTANADPKKRERKITELLNRPSYSNHFSSVLRQQWLPQTLNNQQFQFVGIQFEKWLLTQLRQNTGMDKIVREVLTAPTQFGFGRGEKPVEINRDNTPAGFNEANEFRPENVAAAASRLFMGVKMECAQCHDHPFAPIGREQFWETAAFFAELEPAIAAISDVQLKREIRIDDPDPKKVKVVEARFFDDTDPKWKGNQSPREVFVDWLTSSNNKYFARNGVNRMWGHFFGLGFIDPIDEPGTENPELIPELVDDLARAYVESKYDSRFLIKVITRTKAYQLSSRQTDPSQSNPRHFARMNLKAMTAEQLYDSLSQAAGFIDKQASSGNRFERTNRSEFLTKFSSTERVIERQTSILQALTLMNGKFVDDQTNLDNSQFLSAIADAPFMDGNGKVEALFLASLSRLPTASEAQRLGGYVQSGGTNNDQKKALADLFWALLNSSEFILNH